MRKKESEVHLTYGIAVTPYVINTLLAVESMTMARSLLRFLLSDCRTMS